MGYNVGKTQDDDLFTNLESFPGRIWYDSLSLVRYQITILKQDSRVGGTVGHVRLTMHIYSGIVTK